MVLLATMAIGLQPTSANELTDGDAIPHIDQRARDAYVQQFLQARTHRAFAIAPGGAWAWADAQDTPEAARAAALLSCREYTEQTCVLYTVDDEVVFDPATWPTLWELGSTAATESTVGTRRGERFPDVSFARADEQVSLRDLQGRIVLLHFWGSWCAPCLRELPALDGFIRLLEERLGDSVEVVLLQMREPIGTSRQWIEQQGFTGLPLSDSGATDSSHDFLTTANGEIIPDRQIARVFPSSYVLDQHGRVLFSHTGPIDDWTAYLDFFAAAVECMEAGAEH